MEIHEKRSCTTLLPLVNFDFNSSIDMSQWILPPYKQHFQNNHFVFSKPLLIINNKYTNEWGDGMINYIDLDTLSEILSCLEDTYQIVYSRPLGTGTPDYTVDDNDIMEFQDHAMVRSRHPEVLLFQDILGPYSYNEAQMMLHANCSNFISVHGGMSLVCSMFGPETTNVILTIRGKPIKSAFYPKISGATIKEANTREIFTRYCKEYKKEMFPTTI